MPNSKATHDYAWIILSGGRGSRMQGQDKGWVIHQGEALIAQVIKNLRALNPAIPIVISANRNINKYRSLGVEVIEDVHKNFQGPLEGIVSVMQNSVNQPQKGWLTWPVDSPSCPDLYLHKMQLQNKQQVCVAYQSQSQQYHYAHLTLAVEKLNEVEAYLKTGKRSIHGFIKTFTPNSNLVNIVQFDDAPLIWKNLNKPDDIK